MNDVCIDDERLGVISFLILVDIFLFVKFVVWCLGVDMVIVLNYYNFGLKVE